MSSCHLNFKFVWCILPNFPIVQTDYNIHELSRGDINWSTLSAFTKTPTNRKQLFPKEGIVHWIAITMLLYSLSPTLNYCGLLHSSFLKSVSIWQDWQFCVIFQWTYFVCQITGNKKDLLRERKRHTDRGISSIPYAVLSWGVGNLAGGGRCLGVPSSLVLTWPGGSGVGTLVAGGGGIGTLGYPLPCPDLAGGSRYLGVLPPPSDLAEG